MQIPQPVAHPPADLRSGFCFRGNRLTRIEAATVILDPDLELSGRDAHIHPDTRGASMFERVVQRLLERQKQIVSRLGGQRMMRQPLRDVQFTFHGGVLQILRGIVAEIRGQMFQRVIVRIHRPNDFVQRLQQISRGMSDGIQLPRHGILTLQLAFRPFAHVRNLRQLRADLVVHVLRDPHAFAFE